MIGDIRSHCEFPLNVYACANTIWGYKSRHLKDSVVYSNKNLYSCL